MPNSGIFKQQLALCKKVSTPLHSTRSPVLVGAIPCGRPFAPVLFFGYLIVITTYNRAPARGAPTKPGTEFVVY